jgi:hypothetical protein
MKVCSGCKLEKSLSEFSKKRVTKDGLRNLCKSCESLVRRTINIRYSDCRSAAKKRGIHFDLTLEQFKALIEFAKCYYAGCKLPETKGGLDRLDPNKGYTMDNVVPCCTLHNKMKSTLNEEEFYREMEKILEHRNKKKENKQIYIEAIVNEKGEMSLFQREIEPIKNYK